MEIFSGLWLADYIGSFLNAGGDGVYYFHYLPLPMEHECNDSPGTFGMLTVDRQYNILQPLAQFFTAQLINLEWIVPGAEEHAVFPAKSDIRDDAGHEMVTAYALKRPDSEWSLLLVNRDQQNPYRVKIAFEERTDERINHDERVNNNNEDGGNDARSLPSRDRLKFPYSERINTSGTRATHAR